MKKHFLTIVFVLSVVSFTCVTAFAQRQPDAVIPFNQDIQQR